MDGLFFLMSVVGVGAVMWWVFQNDGVAPDQQTHGLFALLPGSKLAKRRGLHAWIAATAAAAKAKPARKRPF
jgi:hypothetical protein